MTPLTERDIPAIQAFLRTHVATAMFPLSNLRRYGMRGGHARAMRFWAHLVDGQISDLIGMTDEGVLFPVCPTCEMVDMRTILQGQEIKGILGASDQVAALRAQLCLPDQAGLNSIDPHYRLALNDLTMPDDRGVVLRPLCAAPLDVVTAWRAAYIAEVLSIPGQDPHDIAQRDIASYIAADSHRVLYDGDQPVAMTGFNAHLPEAVQIGGVYTPPPLRGQGLARRAVALHLAEARAAGVREAILFAASDAASRTYQTLGFRQIGSFTILMFATPQVVHG